MNREPVKYLLLPLDSEDELRTLEGYLSLDWKLHGGPVVISNDFTSFHLQAITKGYKP